MKIIYELGDLKHEQVLNFTKNDLRKFNVEEAKEISYKSFSGFLSKLEKEGESAWFLRNK